MNSFLQMIYNVEDLRNDIMKLDLKAMQAAAASSETADKKKSLIMLGLYHLQRIFILMTAFKINKEEQDFDFISSNRQFIVPQTFRKTLPIYF